MTVAPVPTRTPRGRKSKPAPATPTDPVAAMTVAFARAAAFARARRGWTQDATATACGIPLRTYRRYELAEGAPGLYDAVTVARVLGFSLDSLA